MATLISYASANWTGATTWKAASTATGAQQTAFTASTNTTTSYVYSTAFSGNNGSTLEGVMFYCNRVNTTGTVSVVFSADGGTTATREVTVNASDLPADPSWVFFKFGSTFAEGNVSTYVVGVKSSSAGNATFYRDATAGNWTRLLRRAATATAAAADVTYVVGELTGAATGNTFTVTMNSTSSATVYGAVNIGNQGLLSYGATAATNYHLKLAGTVSVYGGGTFNIGTVASPIPRDSTAKLEFACASNVQYGLEVNAGGTFNAQGLSRTSGKNIYYALLSADASANATTLSVDTDTGWLSGDKVAVAATGAVLAEYETKTLSGNAGASSLTLSAGLTYAHSGTAPTQAEVINLTRNVQIFGASLTLCTYLVFQTTATVDMDWVEVYWIGSGSATKYGIVALTSTGNCSIQYCSIHDTSTATLSTAFSSSSNTVNNCTFSNNIIYAAGYFGVYLGNATTGTSLTFNDNVCIYSVNNMFQLVDVGGTFNNNRVSGAERGFNLTESHATVGSCTGNIINNCNTAGIQTGTNVNGTISASKIWHNNISNSGNGGGLYFGGLGVSRMTVSNCDFYGNRNGNITNANNMPLFVDTCTFSGTITLASQSGVTFTYGGGMVFTSCTFRSASGIYAAHTVGDFACNVTAAQGQIVLNNCSLGASTEVSSQSTLGPTSYISSAKHDQTAGSHRTWKQYGTITADSTIFKTAAPSERLTPNNASGKLESGSKLVAIANATTKTVSVWVRKSVVGDGTAYNGNQPRLRYRRSDAAGVTADGTITTATSANGNWEQLSGTTPAVTDDCVLEFFVDCDGTTGWINVDDWIVS